LEQPRGAARITTTHVLAARRAELGSLERARSVLKVFGMCIGFNEVRGCIDGWSRRRGNTHAPRSRWRSWVGMAELAHDIAVKIELVVAVDASA